MKQTGSSHTRTHLPVDAVNVAQTAGDGTGRSDVQQNGASNDDPTVISKQSPLASGAQVPLVFEIGRQLEGQMLGHFELREFVGGGGMGSVFRSLDTMLNRTVAVKVLSPDHSHDEDTLRRFKNEAQSAARLDHENIGRVYYVGEDRGLHYIVFEFIEGVNLRDLIEQNGVLSLSDSINYIFQITEALEHASKRDVIHRDIKPSNVVITPDGRAKLVDMGLARLHQVDHSRNDLTASGVTLGTFDYISPEQARDPRNADVRSDIYSLGCTFYFMLTGRPPFPEGTVLQKLLQHQGDEPPDPRDYRPELPEDVTRIIRKMLAKSPDRRYQTPAALIAEIAQLINDLGLRSRSASNSNWQIAYDTSASAWEKHLPWIAPTLLLVVAVFVMHFVFNSNSSSELGDELLRQRREVLEQRRASTPVPVEEPKTLEPTSLPEVLTLPEIAGGTSETPQITTPSAVPNPSIAAEESASPLTNRLEAFVASGAKVAELATAIGTAVEGMKSIMDDTSANGLGASSLLGGVDVGAAQAESRVLVVSPTLQGEHVFANLKAACAAARSGDTVILQYNGVLEERPISITNTSLTIRADLGYRPVVLFKPQVGESVTTSRSMITVTGGELSLNQIPFVLDTPKESTDSWAMFELRQPELLKLESCSLTIRNETLAYNSYGENAAFIRIRSAPGSELATAEASDEEPMQLQLQDCIVRGEAIFLQTMSNQAFRLAWNNGLLATPERLVQITQESGGLRPATVRSHIELNQVTAATMSGLVQLSNLTDSSSNLTLVFDSNRSIFLGQSSSALVEQFGRRSTSELQKQLQWTGNSNFYEGYNVFWRIVVEGGQADTLAYDFERWQAFWGEVQEQSPSRSSIEWVQLPGSGSVPYHSRTPLDYAVLRRSATGTEMVDAEFAAGMRPQLLPSVPAEWTRTVQTSTLPQNMSSGTASQPDSERSSSRRLPMGRLPAEAELEESGFEVE